MSATSFSANIARSVWINGNIKSYYIKKFRGGAYVYAIQAVQVIFLDSGNSLNDYWHLFYFTNGQHFQTADWDGLGNTSAIDSCRFFVLYV